MADCWVSHFLLILLKSVHGDERVGYSGNENERCDISGDDDDDRINQRVEYVRVVYISK